MSNEPLCLENQVCFSLYSAANAMVRAYRPVLDALDLTYPQYLAMLVLWQHKASVSRRWVSVCIWTQAP